MCNFIRCSFIDDGNLVLFDSFDDLIWDTGKPRAELKWEKIFKTLPFDSYSVIGDQLNEGERLKEGEMLANNGFYAVMQLDGNFVLYSSNTFNDNNLLWSSKTASSPFQRPFFINIANRNLIMNDENNKIVWSTEIHDEVTNNLYLKLQG